MKVLYVGLFGILGVYARYFVGQVATNYWGSALPVGTFLINILGSFLIGIAYVYGVERAFLSPELRFGILVGFLGSFTTFSSYTLEGFNLMQGREYLYASCYLALTPLCGLMATVSGVALGRRLLGGSL